MTLRRAPTFIERTLLRGYLFAFLLLLLSLVISACSGGSSNGTMPPPVVTITVLPTSATVTVNGTQQFTATVQNSSNTSVTWQVNGVTGGDATHGTISASGLYQAPASVPSPATVTVTAVSLADTSKSASAIVTITSGPVGVTVSPRVAGLTLKQTQQFQATVQNAGNQSVNWSVDGITGGNATVGTISAAGLYAPPAGAGKHTVTATSVAAPSASASAAVAVTDFSGVFTWHNDTSLTGQNLKELALALSNVNSSQFGRLFTAAVDGAIYAQPLYVADVSIPGLGFRNVVYVATEHDSVYAFDADGKTPSPLWHVSFINPAAGITSVPSTDVNCTDLTPEIGITGTPTIDRQTSTLYVVAKTKENGNYFFRLHALDITTGQEKSGSPVTISAQVAGTGDGSVAGQVTFDAFHHHQRAGLLLANGTVYAAFASHCDNGPYHGWILGYNASTLARTSIFNTTPDGGLGGIWLGAASLSADASGTIFAITGNGTFDANTGGRDFGDSFLKLNASLSLLDFFTPFNEATLSIQDLDVGSSGAVLLPDQAGAHPHVMVSAGKEGRLYVVDRDSLGHFQAANDNQIVQSISGAFVNGLYSTGAYWNGHLYFAPFGGSLSDYAVSNGTLSTAPVHQDSVVLDFPGSTPSVSAQGTSNAIVWTLERDLSTNPAGAVLRAYDATDVSQLLYSSKVAGVTTGVPVKFSVPTIANGKVYFGTQDKLVVFGLQP